MIRLFEETAKKPLDFFDNMKLQGVVLPAFPAVSTPTTVPAGALGATVKLLIVIVMNLSGGAISLCKIRMSKTASWRTETAALFAAASV